MTDGLAQDKEEDARKEKEGEDEGAPTISIIQVSSPPFSPSLLTCSLLCHLRPNALHTEC